MNDSFAFAVFVAIFCGGLAIVTGAMAWIVVLLVRCNRRYAPRGPRIDRGTLR